MGALERRPRGESWPNLVTPGVGYFTGSAS